MKERIELTPGSAADVGMDPARIELIRSRARGWVAAGDTPSLVLLVARKGVIVLEEAYGVLRAFESAPLRTDSIFPVTSLSKAFTAAATLCLVEDGLLSLKHPITDLLPELTTPGADQVLVVDLLTHTSGYDDFVVFPHVKKRYDEQAPVPDASPGQNPVINRLIHYAHDAPLSRAPGAAMCYSNFGYAILGDIVRRVSAEAFGKFVETRVFQALGMNDSYFVLPAELRRSRRVIRDPSFPDVPLLFPPVVFPAAHFPPIDSEALDASDTAQGGAATTARDIAAFAQMLLNGGAYGGRRVLSRASVAAMTTSQLPPGTRTIFLWPDATTGAPVEVAMRGGRGYGYGLFMLTADDRMSHVNGSLAGARSFGHTGAFGTAFWADPDAQVVGVYLSVMPRLRAKGAPLWHYDHFQDMVQAAILD